MGEMMRHFMSILVAVALAPMMLSADIAPTGYGGVTLTPASNEYIRMLREEVDIYIDEGGSTLPCRYACRVHAEFTMFNDAYKTITIPVGFPVEANAGVFEKDREILENIYHFTVHVDGEKIEGLSAQSIKGPFGAHGRNIEYVWFGWENGFDPGETQVDVEYTMLTTPDRTFNSNRLHYSLYSGSLWKDEIGSASVRIHFPDTVQTEMLKRVLPEGSMIFGNIVSWKFVDFEPTREDDIFLEFMSIACFRKIVSARRNLSTDPGNPDYKIDLAAAYLSTMRNVGTGSKDVIIQAIVGSDFEPLLSRIESEADRKFLKASFIADRYSGMDMTVYMRVPLSKADDARVERILFEARYKPYRFGRFDYCGAAEDLIREVLEDDPRNAYVWNLYLSHMFKMVYGAWAPVRWSEMHEMLPYQKDMIRRGYELCPGDEGIWLWYDALAIGNYELPDSLGILKEHGDHIVLMVPDPDGSGDAEGWDLSRDELDIFLVCYERRNQTTSFIRDNRREIEGTMSALWLRSTAVPDEARLEIIRHCDMRLYIRRQRGKRIVEYNEAKGIY